MRNISAPGWGAEKMAININEFAAKEKTWRVKRQGTTIPFGGVFAHYSHDYGGLPHSRTDHISIGPLNVDSVPPSPHKAKAYGFRSSQNQSDSQKAKRSWLQSQFSSRDGYTATVPFTGWGTPTWDASFMMKIGDPGTSPCTCLNNALTSSSLCTCTPVHARRTLLSQNCGQTGLADIVNYFSSVSFGLIMVMGLRSMMK